MLFNSYSFLLLFLPLIFFSYYVAWYLKGLSCAKYVMLFASLIFYAFGAKQFTVLLLVSICFNYSISQKIIKDRNKAKNYLIIGILLNLLGLVYYKYSNFLIQNINFLSGLSIEISPKKLPLGISFFTFTQIAFLVDIYKSDIKKNYSVSDYGTLVSFFPHLVAGPLLHHAQFIPQLNSRNFNIDYQKIYKGLMYIILGLFKKVLLADPIGIYANEIFANGAANFLEAWSASISFSIQLFLDFSGYSDMAVGLALLFQIDIPQNFNAPYRACSIQDFWNRWHMSLSSFLKQYLYIPLGGNRVGEIRTFINMGMTFLLGGLWHGASWTFVIWGMLHAIGVIFYKIYKSKCIMSLPNSVNWLITMVYINICWVFFKADTVGKALTLVNKMHNFSEVFDMDWLEKISNSYVIFVVAFCSIFVFFSTEDIYERVSNSIYGSICAGIILALALFAMKSQTIFLYFNF